MSPRETHPALDTTYAPTPLPPLRPDAHKGEAGRLCCVAGSETMPGAASLVLRAAMRAGAGLCYLAVLDDRLITVLPPMAPEAVFIDLSTCRELLVGRLPDALGGRDDHARACGPGLGTSSRARALVRALAADSFEGPLVVDADGLNLLAGELERLREHAGPVVITPHPGEAARLLGRGVPREEAARVDAALALADRSGATVVLKGHRTVVATAGDGEEERPRAVLNATGNAGMATGGAGDVLTGIVGAYLAAWRSRGAAAGWSLFDAVAAAVHVHGLAGDLAVRDTGEPGLVASDLVAYLPRAQIAFAGAAEAER